MAKKGFVKAAAVVLLFVGAAVSTYAQVTINGGLAMGNAGDSTKKSAIGVLAAVDYRLKGKLPLSVGGEVGLLNSSDYKAGAIPILGRVGYHFGNNPKLDLGLVGKVGFAFGSGDGGKDAKGLAFGVGFDASYYFSPKFGAFAEVGFDQYALAASKTVATEHISMTIDYDLPFTKFLTLGVSYKL
jgi:hypothetical protein